MKTPTKKDDKKGKKKNIILIILIALLAIRVIGNFIGAVISPDTFFLAVQAIFAVIYLLALIGTIKRKKWGLILIFIAAGIDLISALFIGGFSGLGAGIVDVVLIVLAYLEYRKLQYRK